MNISHCFLLVSAVCFAQAPEPRITFDKTHHDFGRILQDAKVSYRFKVTNSGSAPLQIKEIRPSCGCTYSIPGQRLVEAGQETFIEVQFDPAGMIGSIHKSLEVISDDPANPTVLLTFEAGVVKEIMPSTSIVAFDGLSRNSSASFTIHLVSGTDSPVTVTKVEIENAPFLSYAAKQEGNDVALDVTINGKLIPRETNRRIELMTVHTTSRKVPTLLFRVQWDVPSPIAATPSRIVWTGAQGKELKATVTLSHTNNKPFKILGIESTTPNIKTVSGRKDSAAEHQFEVIMGADAKAGMYNERLTVRLDDPDLATLEINIAAVLR
jgi:hypothetical protein